MSSQISFGKRLLLHFLSCVRFLSVVVTRISRWQNQRNCQQVDIRRAAWNRIVTSWFASDKSQLVFKFLFVYLLANIRVPGKQKRRCLSTREPLCTRHNLIGPLQDTITWHKIRHTGTQTAHWGIQNKAT